MPYGMAENLQSKIRNQIQGKIKYRADNIQDKIKCRIR